MSTNREKIFFILGAGASVDSGLLTYRGPTGIYERKTNLPPAEQILTSKYFEKNPKEVWNFLTPLFEQIEESLPGPTYQKIAALCEEYPQSFILTQNVDRLVTKVAQVPVVEIHGRYDQMKCTKCDGISPLSQDKLCKTCLVISRPNIVFFGEDLEYRKTTKVWDFLSRCPDYVVVIGTTLQFPYLRNFIAKAKHRNAKVIHINPDPLYHSSVFSWNEKWIQKSSSEGLDDLRVLLSSNKN